MKAKIQEIKTKRHKEPHEMTHNEKIAAKCDCSVEYVRLVLAGERKSNSELGQKILITDAILKEAESQLLVDAVKQLVPFK